MLPAVPANGHEDQQHSKAPTQNGTAQSDGAPGANGISGSASYSVFHVHGFYIVLYMHAPMHYSNGKIKSEADLLQESQLLSNVNMHCRLKFSIRSWTRRTSVLLRMCMAVTACEAVYCSMRHTSQGRTIMCSRVAMQQ